VPPQQPLTNEELYGCSFETPTFTYKEAATGIPPQLFIQLIENDQLIQRPLIEQDKITHKEHLEQFYRSELERLNKTGTPIELLVNSLYLVNTLKVLDIYTIEQLAHINNSQMDRLGMLATSLFNKAKEYLATNNPVIKLKADMANQDANLSNIRSAIAELKTKLEQIGKQL
jgi:hypothetical protein